MILIGHLLLVLATQPSLYLSSEGYHEQVLTVLRKKSTLNKENSTPLVLKQLHLVNFLKVRCHSLSLGTQTSVSCDSHTILSSHGDDIPTIVIHDTLMIIRVERTRKQWGEAQEVESQQCIVGFCVHLLSPIYVQNLQKSNSI